MLGLAVDETPGRAETSVFYLSENWAELWALLAKPQERLEKFRDKFISVDPWTVKSGITAVLKAAEKRDLIEIAAQTGILDDTNNSSELLALEAPVDAAHQTADLTASLMAAAVDKAKTLIHERFAKGLWRVTLAIDTRTLLIHYVLPVTLADREKLGNYLTLSSIQACTLVQLHSKAGVGRVHYDVGTDPETRADFIMQYVLHRGAIAAHLTGLKKKQHYGVAVMAEVGERLRREPPTPKGGLKFNYKDDGPNEPAIVVEGLGGDMFRESMNTDPCYVCVDDGCVNIGGQWYLNGALVKCYIGAD